MPPAAASPPSVPAEVPRRERILTLPLAAFLAAVASIVGLGLRSKYPTPDVDGAVMLLADGDLDGDERQRMLRLTLEGALRSPSVKHRWAGLLAAVALEDRSAYAAVLALLGPGAVPTAVPAEADRELLHLGDPVLGNMMQALLAEATGHPELSGQVWHQVAAQCRLSARPFAAELAEAGIKRH